MRAIVWAALFAHFAFPACAGYRDDPSRPAYLPSLGCSPCPGRPHARSSRHDAPAISIARRYLGGNPTGRRSLWCADFMNLVEREAGRPGTGSRLARSYLGYGRPVSSPRPGDIVVLWRGSQRGRSGHVGYFMGFDGRGVRLISGNHGRKVGIGTYPTARVLGFRRP
ncbi:TIGR02594 family protein [Microbaculum marinisediminis]|uniref:TIGR02594 family protein n=1 Tax=Microbaculum marinisediminis TaxID=2931392 RepID=A0AAW5QR72_9HYPH|nr:TIGR02594 family protein [Microbaculum sp. A6E488]MCT8970571.1 TIGR02594 family protein [Microbaculum sp. A6E488]